MQFHTDIEASIAIKEIQPTKKGVLFVMLGSRLLLFLLFQAIIALIAHSWITSQKYWLLTATLTNLVSISLLFILFKREGKNYFKIFRFARKTFKKDILVFLGIMVFAGPVALAPNYFLSIWLWKDANIPAEMLFQPIETTMVYILLIAFPVTIMLAELATYYVYIMPGLEKQLKTKWLAVLLPVLFLSLQHCTLPFIPDIKFIFYRALVFLPFALLTGISLKTRPSLFPYFAVLHGIMDFGTAYMLVLEIH